MIKTPKSVLDQMGPWCVDQHGKVSSTFPLPLVTLVSLALLTLLLCALVALRAVWQTGLTQQCIDSPYTLDFVTGEVLKYIKERVPEKVRLV